jgi:hypothetical protein
MRKNAMSSCAVLLALFAAAASAHAQDGTSPERHVGPRDVPFLQGDATIFDINLRVTDLNGEFELGVPTNWDDLWNTGVGVGLSLAFLNEIDSGFHLGPYVALSGDVFMANDEEDLLPLGFEDIDDLIVGRGMVGVATRFTFGPVFLEARAGLGGVFYTATELTPTAGTAVEILEGSAHFGWEARGTFGAMIGDSSSITISFGYETNDGPNGTDGTGLEPKDLKSFVLQIGLSFRL